MKKLVCLFLTMVMIVSSLAFTALADDGIKIVIDGEEKTFDAMPVIVNSRTLVPMRGIFEAFRAVINWDDATKTVSARSNGSSITLKIGDANAVVNGKTIELDCPAQIVSDRTMVPVRFVAETLGCKVEWNGEERKVIINKGDYDFIRPGMATLVSDVHRNVPTEFTKTNDMNDILHFEKPSIEEQEKVYNELKPKGEIVCDNDEFLEEFSVKGAGHGSYEVVNVEGQSFDRALRIKSNSKLDNPADFIVKTKATPERVPGEGVKKEDALLLAFRMRCIDGGDETGTAKVLVQVEELKTGKYRKAVFDVCYAGKDWEMVYFPFKPQVDATAIGIRAGYFEQTVEIGGFEIINFGPDYDKGSLPSTSNNFPELKPGAKWRTEAFDRIEKNRKGDFTVVVKDKDGNVVPDAQVELDMFEHEFQFGTAINGNVNSNADYQKALNREFNSAVLEHNMKWHPYEENPAKAQRQVQSALNQGIKYVRGHAMIWEKPQGGNKSGWITPEDMFAEPIISNKEVIMERSKNLIEKMAKDEVFYDVVTDWDVVNESMSYDAFRKVHGNDLLKFWFDTARETVNPDAKLFYNESTCIWQPEFWDMLDVFEKENVDYDGIGIQSHYDLFFKTPVEMVEFYDKIVEKTGKRLKATEFSCSVFDPAFQANFVRDAMIAIFAEENMDGFLMWGFWQGSLYAEFSPMYNYDWTINDAGRVYEDLVYNKWWTRDAKAKTDKDGKATIRGFYGDYDVKVTAAGKEKNVMAAFHKNYENVLEIVVE